MWTQSRAGPTVRRCIASQRGIALLIVLWGLVLLAVIAAAFTAETRTEINLTRNLIDSAKAESAADSGVYRAIMALFAQRYEEVPGTDIGETLARVEPLTDLIPRTGTGGRLALPTTNSGPRQIEERWRTDGTLYQWRFGDHVVHISIQDEGGKIDLNTGKDELLRGLFVSVGLDEQQADIMVNRINDFRDPDGLHRLSGAEDEDYEHAGLPYRAKDAPFEAVEELQRVLGMTYEVYKRVLPALTVHSRKEGIDHRSAPREVLLALPGVDADNVEHMLEIRSGGLGEPRVLWLEQYQSRSRHIVYAIRAEARGKNGSVFVREVLAMPIRGRRPSFTFLAWKRGERFALGTGEKPTQKGTE